MRKLLSFAVAISFAGLLSAAACGGNPPPERQQHTMEASNRGATSSSQTAVYGVYRGVVVDTKDPLSRMRVRVRVPEVLGDRSAWAEASVTPGMRTTPDSGAVVWVAFEGGDPDRPIWLGVNPPASGSTETSDAGQRGGGGSRP